MKVCAKANSNPAERHRRARGSGRRQMVTLCGEVTKTAGYAMTYQKVEAGCLPVRREMSTCLLGVE